MRIFLVSHGRTEWNLHERFRGRADIALDETGAKQARATAIRLADSNPAVIYSSPLQRTLMTANSIASITGSPVKPIDGLIDIDYGSWQGLSLKEARIKDSDLYDQWIEQPDLVKFPNGESLGEVRRRVESIIQKMLDACRGQTIIMVSHLVVCRVFICAILGLGNSHIWQIGQDPCAINVIGIRNNHLVLNSLNDTYHLTNLIKSD